MSSSFQKRGSQIFLGVFIGVIVVSFAMSGPFLNSGTPDSIGSIAGHDIKLKEFNYEVQRQSQFYANFLNGQKPLTSKQMRQYGIHARAIQSLANQKLQVVLAEQSGIYISNEEIKKEVMSANYFQTGGKFDINRYKALLAANSITPEDFEKDTENRLMLKRFQSFASEIPFSGKFQSELESLHQMNKEANVYTLNFNELKKTLKITSAEVTKYLKDNKNKVEAQYNQRKASFDKPAQVKARHILVKVASKKEEAAALKRINDIRKKVTVKNFAKMAKKHTDEASGKKSGGKLGWFSKGKMVKEFEAAAFAMKKNEISKPIKTQFGYHIILVEGKKKAVVSKLADHQNAIAKEMIQKERDVSKLATAATKEIEARLNSGKSMKKLISKYKLGKKDKVLINRLEGIPGEFTMTTENINKIFSGAKKVHSLEESTKVTFIQVTKEQQKAAKPFALASSKNMIANENIKSLIKGLQDKYQFKQNRFAKLPQ